MSFENYILLFQERTVAGRGSVPELIPSLCAEDTVSEFQQRSVVDIVADNSLVYLPLTYEPRKEMEEVEKLLHFTSASDCSRTPNRQVCKEICVLYLCT